MWKAIPVVTLILFTSCTDTSSSPGATTPVGSRDQSTTATSPASAGVATLVVRQRYRGSETYIEGSIGFVEVSEPGTSAVTRWERQILGRDGRHFYVAPGTYSLTSWQRPCDGNCQDGLDPPVDACEASVTLGVGETVIAIVRVTPDSGCTIPFQ
jgi:hypothetical protein